METFNWSCWILKFGCCSWKLKYIDGKFWAFWFFWLFSLPGLILKAICGYIRCENNGVVKKREILDLLHGIFHTFGSFHARAILNWGPHLGSKLVTRAVKNNQFHEHHLKFLHPKMVCLFRRKRRKEMAAVIYSLLINTPLPYRCQATIPAITLPTERL